MHLWPFAALRMFNFSERHAILHFRTFEGSFDHFAFVPAESSASKKGRFGQKDLRMSFNDSSKARVFLSFWRTNLEIR